MAGVDLEDLARCSQTLKPSVTGGVVWGLAHRGWDLF